MCFRKSSEMKWCCTCQRKLGRKSRRERRGAEPEPFGVEVAARVREEHAGNDPEREEAHGVFRLHAQADGGADSQPPAGILALEQANHEVRGEDPKKIIEGDVLHERAAGQTKRNRGEGGDQLRATPAAKFFGHEAGENNRGGLDECREETETDERSTEQKQGETPEERSDGRVGNVAPVEVAGIIEGGEFVAMKAVVAAGDQMNHDGGKRDEEEKHEISGPE